jgi:hypothetical protein
MKKNCKDKIEILEVKNEVIDDTLYSFMKVRHNKPIKRIFIKGIILTLLFIVSCTPHRYLAKHETEICNKCIDKYTVQTIKDSIITKIDTLWIDVSENIIDSTYTELYFECDSDNQVLMTKIEKIKESGQILSQYKFKNNILTVQNKSYQDSIQELRTIIEHNKNNVQIVEKIIKEKIVSKWIYFVGIIVFLFLLILLIIILKK